MESARSSPDKQFNYVQMSHQPFRLDYTYAASANLGFVCTVSKFSHAIATPCLATLPALATFASAGRAFRWWYHCVLTCACQGGTLDTSLLAGQTRSLPHRSVYAKKSPGDMEELRGNRMSDQVTECNCSSNGGLRFISRFKQFRLVQEIVIRKQ